LITKYNKKDQLHFLFLPSKKAVNLELKVFINLKGLGAEVKLFYSILYRAPSIINISIKSRD